MSKILVLQGPNLNLLGQREPAIYGSQSLAALHQAMREHAQRWHYELTFLQSQIEGELINAIQQASAEHYCGIIANFAAYAHTSISLLDACRCIDLPIIEVHLSNVYQREAYRQTLLTAAAASGIITGLGSQGYLLALTALHHLLTNQSE